MTGLPDFATNGGSDGLRVADAVNGLLRALAENKVVPPPVAIATAYINPGGFVLLADELERAPHVRLLLGAEPDEDTVRALAPPPASDRDERWSEALTQHDAWVRLERDSLGFERISNAQAHRLVEWLRSADAAGNPRVEVRRYTNGFLHGKAYLVEDAATPAALAGSSNMTYAGLAVNAELNLGTGGGTHSAAQVQAWFDAHWAASGAYDLAGLYADLWTEHPPWQVFLRMLWELYGTSLDEEAPAPTLGALTSFQADGVARMKRLLDELGGVLVADEVGLGKTYLAGEVIQQANEVNRQRVLVVAPAALKRSMWDPFLDAHGFSRLTKVYSYEQIRNRLNPPGGDDGARREREKFVAELRDYAMVVVDEAHNLRNAGTGRAQAIDEAILSGAHPKKVVLLTATPVNNSLADLETLIRYFVRDDARFASVGIPSIHAYIRRAQAIDPENLTPEHLFDLMDQVAVRRTRRFIQENYPGEQIKGPDGQYVPIRFPKSRVRRIDYPLDEAGLALVNQVIEVLTPLDDGVPLSACLEEGRLSFARYTPSLFLRDGSAQPFELSNAGLLRSALLKRLESSPQAFAATLRTLVGAHEGFLRRLDDGRGWVITGEALQDWASSGSDDLDAYVAGLDDAKADQATRADLYRWEDLQRLVESDLLLMRGLLTATESALEPPPAGAVIELDGERVPVLPGGTKATVLVHQLTRIAAESERIDPGGIPHRDRRKVVVFSTFSDTIFGLWQAVTQAIEHAGPASPLALYRGRIAPPVMGAYASTLARRAHGSVDQGGRASIIEGFAPKTAGPRGDDGQPTAGDEFDLLLTTDVLAEGVNLQQAGQIVNYDLPWNPMRIVQRNGRIDRIGSQYPQIHVGEFFPADALDAMLHLEDTLNRKLDQANAAVGAGEVLPGRSSSSEVNLYDPSQAVEQLEGILNAGGVASAALSGEEYRRRLFNASHAVLPQHYRDLPYGSGSGFESPTADGNGYVFCIKIADHPQPWFRYVRCDADWDVAYGDGLRPLVDGEPLRSLRTADPGGEMTDPWMTGQVYDKAFDAWLVARDSAWQAWQESADPANLAPDVPKAFRSAAALVYRADGFLSSDERQRLLQRLNTVPAVRVARAVRAILDQAMTDEQRITRIVQVLDDAGVQAAPSSQPLAEVALEEVRLVVWMAVRGSRET